MIRRQFLRMIGLAGIGTLPAVGLAASKVTQTVTYRIKGFTCITCATGLDTLLERTSGVAWSRSNYQEGKSTICFHPDLITEKTLRACIADMGFTAERSI